MKYRWERTEQETGLGSYYLASEGSNVIDGKKLAEIAGM
jgi:hypothetical protein